MLSRKVLLLAAPGCFVACAIAVGACGGNIASGGTSDDGDPPVSFRPPRPGGPRQPRDASTFPVVDAATAPCECTDELVQVPGTCNFTIGASLIACVSEHGTDAGDVATLPGTLSCAAAPDAGASTDGGTSFGTSWTPTATPDQLTLCGCTPGEQHALCARYF